MSILIKGMEMPKTCHCCRMCVQVSDGDLDWHWECCLLCEKVERYATDRIPGCPLVPVPPHGRLIEAEPIMKFITDGLNSGEFGYDQIKVLAELQYAPTIIPAEEGDT